MVGRHDVVICDKLDHASIIDGCLLSGADLVRFRHNDMADLERCLRKSDSSAAKLVVVDAVFSMDGDIANLPRIVELCHKYGAWLMVDEAHSVGVLGKTGRGIEEHFGLDNVIDLKMGTLSKTIPSVGGYLAGGKDLMAMFRHASRAFIFSAAMPPAQAAAAKAAFEVILDEPERVETLRRNAARFTMASSRWVLTPCAPRLPLCRYCAALTTEAYTMVRYCQHDNIFVLPVVSPAVPEGQARLRATVTAAHTADDIDTALAVFESAGKRTGII